MADEWQLARLLRRSVGQWNQWKKENSGVKVNLRYADLSGANLIGADLSNAKLNKAKFRNAHLSNADLSGANLIGADLRDAKLSYAKLSGAKLSGADLRRTQALYTNFEGATLTEACIEDWSINSKTNLDGVVCEYVYLGNGFTDRRPHDPDRNFEPGEFAQIFQKVHETLDLYFKDGIDWQAAAYSFQQIATTDGTPLDIEGVNKTKDGGVVITVNVPDSLDKGKVEGDFWKGYEMAQKAFEGERRATERHLESQERQINQLMAKLDGFRTINITGNTIQGSGYTEELKGSGYTEGDNTTNAGD